MLVTCPACQTPVFVRSSAVEQGRAQRCFSCQAQLRVAPDGGVSLLDDAPKGPPASRAVGGGSVPPPISGVFDADGTAANGSPAPSGGGADKTRSGEPRPVSLADLDTSPLRAPSAPARAGGPEPVTLTDLAPPPPPSPQEPPLALAVELDLGFPDTGVSPNAKLPWEPSQEGAPVLLPPGAVLAPHVPWGPPETTEPRGSSRGADGVARAGRPASAADGESDEATDPPLPLAAPPPSGLDEADLEELEPVGPRPADSHEGGPAPVERGGRLRLRLAGLFTALAFGVALGGAGAFFFARVDLPPEEQQVARARALIDDGEAAEAARLLEEVLASSPDHAEATLHLARALSLTGDVDAAERRYLRWLRLAPDDHPRRPAVRAHLGLGQDG